MKKKGLTDVSIGMILIIVLMLLGLAIVGSKFFEFKESFGG